MVLLLSIFRALALCKWQVVVCMRALGSFFFFLLFCQQTVANDVELLVYRLHVVPFDRTLFSLTMTTTHRDSIEASKRKKKFVWFYLGTSDSFLCVYILDVWGAQSVCHTLNIQTLTHTIVSYQSEKIFYLAIHVRHTVRWIHTFNNHQFLIEPIAFCI